MCGIDPGDEGCDIVPCCDNGHWLHEACLRYIDADTLACPLCRSTAIRSVRQTACLPMECLERTPVSNYGAAVAMRVGIAELTREAASSCGGGAGGPRFRNVVATMAARL